MQDVMNSDTAIKAQIGQDRLDKMNQLINGISIKLLKGEISNDDRFGLILLVIVAFYMYNSSNAGGSSCINHESQAHTSPEKMFL